MPRTIGYTHSTLAGVVENDAEREPFAAPDRAHAVPHGRAIISARGAQRTMSYRENHRFTLCERYHMRTRLHPRALLCEQEFAAFKIALRRRQENRELKRENQIAIQVLMQAIVAASRVF